jgi:hypothetical protein
LSLDLRQVAALAGCLAQPQGGKPPRSARHPEPVLRPMPTRRQASTFPTPATISFQYSSSTASCRLRPVRPNSTPLSERRGVATSPGTPPVTTGSTSAVVDRKPGHRVFLAGVGRVRRHASGGPCRPCRSELVALARRIVSLGRTGAGTRLDGVLPG